MAEARNRDEIACVEFDRKLNRIDRIYSGFARTCGISECAYWMICDTAAAGGTIALNRLTAEWCYSKQTINSALKTMVTRGLARLEYAEGSRKNKVVNLTDEGRAYAERYTEPAIAAELRAFGTLSADEQKVLMELLEKYADALDAELCAFKGALATNEKKREECL